MDDTPKGQTLKLIVIVPAFNEQERIDATISALLAEKPIFASKPISFGVLIAAQALGDRQALLDAGRKVMRFDLGEDVAGSLRKLTS